MMRNGRDVSELNGPLSREWFAQWDFVIIRASNERGRTDARAAQYLYDSKGVTARGVYGWPIAGADNAALGRTLGQLAIGLELGGWADYERGGRLRMPTATDVADYCAGTLSAGVVAGWYSNRSDYVSTPALDAFPWWYANPSGNPDPRDPAIVQTGIVNGVDTDTMTDQWFARLTGAPTPQPIGDDEMLTVIFGQDTPGHQVAHLCQGGRAVVTWTAGPFTFGAPAGALDYVAKNPGTPLVLAEPADLARVVTP